MARLILNNWFVDENIVKEYEGKKVFEVTVNRIKYLVFKTKYDITDDMLANNQQLVSDDFINFLKKKKKS